jgi:hypothetical protein
VFVAKVTQAIEETENQKWFSGSEIKDLPMVLDNKSTLSDLGLNK